MSKEKTAHDATSEHQEINLYLGKTPSVVWWTLGYSIDMTCDSDESARALFEALQHVIEIDAD